MDGHNYCVLVVSLGHRCYPNASGDDFKGAWSTLLGIPSPEADAIWRQHSSWRECMQRTAAFASSCLPWHAWQPRESIQYFRGCHMWRWCSLFGECSITTCLVVDVVSAQYTLPLCLQKFCQLCVLLALGSFTTSCLRFTFDVLHIGSFVCAPLSVYCNLCCLNFSWPCWVTRACVPN